MSEEITLLQQAELFSKLQQRELEVIAEYSEFAAFPDNGMIFSAGSPGNALYIIKEGEVRIITHTEHHEELEIAHFIRGECFGELDFFENAPRTADAVAETETNLLCFPARGTSFTDILTKYPSICARILHKLITLVAGRIRYTNKLVSEKTPWIEDLRKQVLYDKLTGLYNRSYLDEDFKAQLTSFGERTALLVIKPDNFKEINDRFGHAAGDKVLRVLADMVRVKLSTADIGVRLRGDEFAVVLPGKDAGMAQNLAQDLRRSIRDFNIQEYIGDDDFRLTASVGITLFPDHTRDAHELVDKAFAAMWRARESGGNVVLVWGQGIE